MRRTSGRTESRGFTLIELGIVIAVIAVLATVVIFGLGFLQGSRVTKTTEAVNAIRKAASTFAGLSGGTVGQSTANEITPLVQRGLLPQSASTGTWLVTGSGTNAFTVTAVQFGQDMTVTPSQNSTVIRITTPNVTTAVDVWRQFRGTGATVANDPNLIMNTPTIGTLPCPGNTVPTSNVATLCFHL